MATGQVDRGGNVTITFNMQAEHLSAPNGGKYLPCEACGAVVEVPLNVVATLCPSCEALTCAECGLKHRNPTCASACCTMQGGECGCGEEDPADHQRGPHGGCGIDWQP